MKLYLNKTDANQLNNSDFKKINFITYYKAY